MTTTEMPKVNMLAISKNSQRTRKMIKGFAPDIGLTIVDYGRNFELDAYYLLCQGQRDFYRDPSNKIRINPFFLNSPCGPFDHASASFLMPTRYHRDDQPVVYPYTYKKDFLTPFCMIGTYDEGSDVHFKR